MGKLKRDFFKCLPKITNQFMAKEDMAPPQCNPRAGLFSPSGHSEPQRALMAHYTRAWVRSGHLCMSQEVTSKRLLCPHTSATVRATGCPTSYPRHLRICQAFPSTNRIPKLQTKCLAKGLLRQFIKNNLLSKKAKNQPARGTHKTPARPQQTPCIQTDLSSHGNRMPSAEEKTKTGQQQGLSR